MSRSSSASSDSSDSDLDDADYRPLGYHCAAPGDVVGPYTLINQLGFGYYATVWQATRNDLSYAVKICKSHELFTEAALDEVQICNALRDSPHCVRLHEHFFHEGPNGSHACLVFDLLGPDTLRLLKKTHYRGLGLNTIKSIARHTLAALDHMHGLGYIHTDVKLENVLLSTAAPDAAPSFQLADFGTACHETRHNSDDIQTLHYRAPEIIIGAPYNSACDLWSVACMIFELYTGNYLFDPSAGCSYASGRPMRYHAYEDHLAQIIETLGSFPRDFAARGIYAHKYFGTGWLLKLRPWSRPSPLRHIYHLSATSLLDKITAKRPSHDDAQQLLDFILPMLQIEPRKRATAKQQLQHPWLVNVSD